LLVAAYVGSYFALVERIADHVSPPEPLVSFPVYRLGGRLSEKFFAPLHEADRRIRSEYWGTEPPSPWRITPANFKRLHRGMKMADVEALFGCRPEYRASFGYFWDEGWNYYVLASFDASGYVRGASLVPADSTPEGTLMWFIADKR
jgi:hypothetical protein